MDEQINSGYKEQDTEHLESIPDVSTRGEKKYYLVVLQGIEVGRHLALESQPLRIGRSTEMELCLRDQRVSTEHCRVYIEDGVVYVEDRASTNGTYVNDERVRGKAILVSDDILQVGHTVLRLTYRTPLDLKRETDLFRAATTDHLTGMPNRQTFLERARQEVAYAIRHGVACTLLLIDADHFKEVNDNYGHPAGDQVLREMGRIFLQQTRVEDLCARFGGEEFIFFLRNATAEQAGIFAERVRNTLANNGIIYSGIEIPVTISAGICCNPDGKDLDLDALIRCADEALYDAKGAGRNCVRTIEYCYAPNQKQST